MRGIPNNPIDGVQYSGLWKGVPAVLEYDAPTGGFKLVVATEAGVAINISGTVEVTGGQLTVVGGSAYGEDSPHSSGATGTYILGVRSDIPSAQTDAQGDYTSLLTDSLGRLHTFVSGSYVNVISDLPLDAINDEVTAYITGSTSLNLMGKLISRAVINFSGSAASETALVAAVGGQQIKVLEVMLIGNTDVTIFFQSGYTGTALTGPMSLPADGDGFFVETPAQIEAHHFETVAGEALVLDIDANVLLGGWINYYIEA